MTLRLFVLILASVSLSALAQLALKLGTNAAIAGSSDGISAEIGGFTRSPMILLGFGLYGLGAILWLFVLGRAPLSLAYPFVGLGFILTMLAGLFVLGEGLSLARIVGTLMIAAGCILVARSA